MAFPPHFHYNKLNSLQVNEDCCAMFPARQSFFVTRWDFHEVKRAWN